MQNRNRNSYLETSYTGVGAFSSAPAPHSNALAAASVIGNALKKNNHNPNNLDLPKLQAPKAPPKLSRTSSVTSSSNYRRNSTRNPSITESSYINTIRTNSINTASARRMSLTTLSKQRLQSQKSAPNLKTRRSVSDFTNSNSNNRLSYLPRQNIPKTIKKYVPSANGLVSVEVPNPKHPDNMPQSKQKVNSLSRQSVGNGYINNRFSSLKVSDSRDNYTSRQTSMGNKNIKRETRTLPNGTKIISTTVEEYITDPNDEFYPDNDNDNYDDTYDGFDDAEEVHNFNEHDDEEVDMTMTLDEINEEDENASVEKLPNDHNVLDSKVIDDETYETEGKRIIESNEKLESHERESAFKSVNEPIKDTVIMEDLLSRNLVHSITPSLHHLNNKNIISPHLIGTPSSGFISVSDMGDEKANENSEPFVENDDYKDIDDEDDEINAPLDNIVIVDENKELLDEVEDDNKESDYVDDIPESMDEVGEFASNPPSDVKASNEYSEEEYLAAQAKLDELVKQKQQEILDSMIKNGEVDVNFVDGENIHDQVETEVDDHIADVDVYVDGGIVEDVQINVNDNDIIDEGINEIDGQYDAVSSDGSVYPDSSKDIELPIEQSPSKKSYSYYQDDPTSPNKNMNFHTTSNNEISTDVPAVESFEKPLFFNVDENKAEEFYTPPATPLGENQLFSNATETSVAATETEPEIHKTMNSLSIDASPDSSIVHDSVISATQPLKPAISVEKKSMAQHLRPTVEPLNKSVNSTPIQAANRTANISQNSTLDNQRVPISAIPSSVHGLDDESEDDELNELDHLAVPKREPSIQAKIDLAEKRKTLELNNSDVNLASGENKSVDNLTKRKSVLKNSQGSRSSLHISQNQQNNASPAYLSLATAQNTKLNAMNSVSSKNQNINNLQESTSVRTRSRAGSAASSIQNSAHNNNVYTPLAAASKAAQRHSVQQFGSNGFNNDQFDNKNKRNLNANPKNGANDGEYLSRVGSVKAPNPKVEEAKKRILQNRPGAKRSKELLELSKTRPHVKKDDLIALNDTSYVPRRSSFEKEQSKLGADQNIGQTKMTSLSLRDLNSYVYENQDHTKHSNRGYKSRFADDNSDTDLPLPPINTTVAPATSKFDESSHIPAEPLNNEKTRSNGFKFKFGGINRKKSKSDIVVNNNQNFATPSVNQNVEKTSPRKPSGLSSLKTHLHSNNNSNDASNGVNDSHKESKFQKFFVDQHGPRTHRNVSTASHATTNSQATESKKKRGFFKKMFSDEK